jgi:hypothetical protein
VDGSLFELKEFPHKHVLLPTLPNTEGTPLHSQDFLCAILSSSALSSGNSTYLNLSGLHAASFQLRKSSAWSPERFHAASFQLRKSSASVFFPPASWPEKSLRQ